MYVPPFLVERLIGGDVPVRFDRLQLAVLNYYNIALSVVIAALLFEITGCYAADPWARAAFVLATFYGTFLWNYLRAQSSEIFQVLYFLTFYLTFSRVLSALFPPEGQGVRPPRLVHWALSWLFVGCLSLLRTSYVLLMAAPWVVTSYSAWVARTRSLHDSGRRVLWSLLPSLCILGVIAGVNQLKFGSPFLTGYHQWSTGDTVMTNNLNLAIYGFLFSMQKSIFIHFPILALAAFGCSAFARQHRAHAVLAFGIFLAFFIFIGKLPLWRGDWCYGPRYLLFVLPVLSLPFVTALERWFAHPWRWSSQVGLVFSAVVIGTSIAYQVGVNRLGFFAYFTIKQPIETNMGRAAADYFRRSHPARINADLNVVRSDPDELIYVSDARTHYDLDFMNSYVIFLKGIASRPNYYWPYYGPPEWLWPGSARSPAPAARDRRGPSAEPASPDE